MASTAVLISFTTTHTIIMLTNNHTLPQNNITLIIGSSGNLVGSNFGVYQHNTVIRASSRLALLFRFHQRRTLLQALFHQLLPLTPIISWPGSIVQHHIFETRILHFRIITFYISTLHRLLNRNTINHGLTLLSARLLSISRFNFFFLLYISTLHRLLNRSTIHHGLSLFERSTFHLSVALTFLFPLSISLLHRLLNRNTINHGLAIFDAISF